MLGVTELASILSLTRPAVHKILTKEVNIPKTTTTKSLKVPCDAVSKILKSRGMTYPDTKAIFGIEKGGNGKSTLTLMAALCAARRGCPVVIIDTDPEGCCTQFLMKDDFDLANAKTIYEVFKENLLVKDCLVESRFDGIKFLPARAYVRRAEKLIEGENPKKLMASKLKGIHDHARLVLFDVPPMFGLLVSSLYIEADIVILPVCNDAWSLDSLDLTIADIKEVCDRFDAKIPELRVLRNKTETVRRKNQKETESELREGYGNMLLPYEVKNSSFIANSINDGVSIFDNNSKTTASIRQSLNDIFSYICPLENTAGE